LLSMNTRNIFNSHRWHSASLMPKTYKQELHDTAVAFEGVKGAHNELQG